jgi:hypothetical protein
VIFHQKYRETLGEFFLCLIFGKLCQVFEITKWEKKKTMVMGFSTPLIYWSSKLIQAFHPVLDSLFCVLELERRDRNQGPSHLVFYFSFETNINQ